MYRVVAIGDSFASGQGAPDAPIDWLLLRFSPKWENRRCNRSENASTARAVAELRKDPAFANLKFTSFACSGASIQRGVLAGYRGSEPPLDKPGDLLPPQIDEIKKMVDQHIPIDALTINVGGNDVLFEYIMGACILSQGGWQGNGCNLVDPIVDERLKLLKKRLRRLATRIDAIDPMLNLRIIMLEYPDPARTTAGGYCDRSPHGDLLQGISACESTWISACVLPRLNYRLCQIAAAKGWRYVGGIAARFDGHGWCAGDNWINTINHSWKTQGHYRGGVHPNADGYAQVADRLNTVLGPMLLGAAPTPVTCVRPVLPAVCKAPCGVKYGP